MTYKPYQPNERIVDRAVVVWKAMLANPKYDNLGPKSGESRDSIMSNTMASMLADLSPKNNAPDVLERFGLELKKILMRGHKWKGEGGKEYETLPRYLDVDYHPDQFLSAAADLAGLKMEFPWKTHMGIHEDCFTVSNGYGAPTCYHYPLSSDRWLVTRLCGEDMPKIIALVEGGVLDLNLEPNPISVRTP